MHKSGLKSGFFVRCLSVCVGLVAGLLYQPWVAAETRLLSPTLSMDIPSGFQEVSREGLPASVLIVLRSAKAATLNCNLLLQPGRLEVSESNLGKLGEDATLSIRRAGMVSAELRNSRVLTISGRNAAHFEYLLQGENTSKLASILLPFGENHLVLTISSATEQGWDDLVASCVTALHITAESEAPPSATGHEITSHAKMLLANAIPLVIFLGAALLLNSRFRRRRASGVPGKR